MTWVAQVSRVTGWTMREVRAHTMRDVRTILAVIDDERREQERAQRRRKGHAESLRMSRGA